MATLSEGQKVTLRAIQIGGAALSAGQLTELDAAMTDGTITLDDPTTAGVNESEITDAALLTALTPFNNNTPADNVIDGGDTIADGTPPADDGAGATDLFAAADITAANGWVETAAGSGIFVNSNEHKIYIGDAATGTISITTVLGADAANSSQYTVIMDDDNGNTASVTVDCAIDELIVDNDMLNATGTTGGEAKATVTFGATGSVNSIWNDVDAIRADINTSITGVVIAAGGAGVKNTNSLDVSENITAKDSNVATASAYNVNRTLESAGGAVLTMIADQLNVIGTVDISGSADGQIGNATFGKDLSVNVKDNRNFTAATETTVNFDNLTMNIHDVKTTTVAANTINAGNIFSLNLDAQGTGEVAYNITGTVNQKLNNLELGDDKAAPAPNACDPYNILEINVADNANVSTSSKINMTRNQVIDGVTIGSGVGTNQANQTMPFTNGTYVDQKFFGANTVIAGEETMKNMDNLSSNVTMQLRNENIWLADGEDESKYRKMSFADVQALDPNKFFAGGAQNYAEINGKFESLNNGHDLVTGGGGGTDLATLLSKIKAAYGAAGAATFATVNADASADGISIAEFKAANPTLTDAEVTTIFATYAGGGTTMSTTQYTAFTTAVTAAT